MPGRDGTGPNVMGPKSGRGFGSCGGLGFGYGRGYRRMACLTGLPGWMRCGYPVAADELEPAQEKAALEERAKFLANQLEQVKTLLKQLEPQENP